MSFPKQNENLSSPRTGSLTNIIIHANEQLPLSCMVRRRNGKLVRQKLLNFNRRTAPKKFNMHKASFKIVHSLWSEGPLDEVPPTTNHSIYFYQRQRQRKDIALRWRKDGSFLHCPSVRDRGKLWRPVHGQADEARVWFCLPTLRQAWPRVWTRGHNLRSRCRCSMCPAIHIKERSWLKWISHDSFFFIIQTDELILPRTTWMIYLHIVQNIFSVQCLWRHTQNKNPFTYWLHLWVTIHTRTLKQWILRTATR